MIRNVIICTMVCGLTALSGCSFNAKPEDTKVEIKVKSEDNDHRTETSKQTTKTVEVAPGGLKTETKTEVKREETR